jgi:hypothetical protein
VYIAALGADRDQATAPILGPETQGGLLDRLPDGDSRSDESFPPLVLLYGTPDGTLCLTDERGWRLTAAPTAEGYVVERQKDAPGWVLEEDRSGAGGFILRDGSGGESAELGRTTRSAGPGEGVSPASLLLGDGRLFRIVLRDPMKARFELVGWEADGAYLVARGGDDGWRITRTPAGSEMKAGSETLLLFGAEILAQQRHEI